MPALPATPRGRDLPPVQQRTPPLLVPESRVFFLLDRDAVGRDRAVPTATDWGQRFASVQPMSDLPRRQLVAVVCPTLAVAAAGAWGSREEQVYVRPKPADRQPQLAADVVARS